MHKQQFSIFLAALAAIPLIAQPAYADRGRDRDREWHRGHSRHHHRDWHGHGHRHHRWHDSHVTIYRSYTTPPPVYYVEPVPVYAARPSYRSEIRCVNRYNPLGALIGGVAGGVIGSTIGKGHGNTAAIISGTVLGGVAGGAMTQDCSEDIFETAPVGVPVSWQSASAQEYYSVTPTRDFRTNGRYCREYQATAKVGGRTRDTYGTACMQPDGSWEIIN